MHQEQPVAASTAQPDFGELKISHVTELNDGLRLFTAPYVSLRESVYRISAGDLIPSHLRKEFPEPPSHTLLSANRLSGSLGFADFRVSKENGSLDLLVIAVEPHARGGKTFHLLLKAIEDHARSLELRQIRALDVNNEKLARVLPHFGFTPALKQTLTKNI